MHNAFLVAILLLTGCFLHGCDESTECKVIVWHQAHRLKWNCRLSAVISEKCCAGFQKYFAPYHTTRPPGQLFQLFRNEYHRRSSNIRFCSRSEQETLVADANFETCTKYSCMPSDPDNSECPPPKDGETTPAVLLILAVALIALKIFLSVLSSWFVCKQHASLKRLGVHPSLGPESFLCCVCCTPLAFFYPIDGDGQLLDRAMVGAPARVAPAPPTSSPTPLPA
eukprot:TRINITY_DN16715_c0_g1_i3.p1 TRINITY_DN16715_c0_g1~~TRINITY_DN16715_c0_g1_i3.p1  ORF type:complete len:225 (+),score=12.22 TRINITY_DN16715_c0_g1_i3:32-706(+)